MTKFIPANFCMGLQALARSHLFFLLDLIPEVTLQLNSTRQDSTESGMLKNYQDMYIDLATTAASCSQPRQHKFHLLSIVVL